ncbi:hypothetical protein VRU48_01845 [Pedobacter sp. KR3-3]|uniref:Uncharacterized protein n=1 Tax=Pedobacter albus TaxID=3113905 RepID=A0ABU7I2Y7_9SPHI|nr:hypothetical protein [Pedobacter sp. KR3-3]MEE1943830.1 hypothetical protein [Pedobacter sp. KR3-3]
MNNKKYIGMTVNERLCVAKLYDKFYKAVEEKNVEEAVSMLKKVELTEESIDPILESVGLFK